MSKLTIPMFEEENMRVGYARVSTKDQSFDLQIDALKKAKCDELFKEMVSGAKTARPVLDDLLFCLRSGDVLVIWKLDRLGRSLKHLVTLTNELWERQIDLISLNDPMDTTTAQGRLAFNILAVLAEFERDLIRERSQAGLEATRARGRKGGGPGGLSKQAEATAMAAETLYQKGKLRVQAICDRLSLSKPTLYAYLRHRGVKAGSRLGPEAKPSSGR